MSRAGKEPAEDVKRAFIRAIQSAGLQVHRVQMFKGGVTGRFVIGTANPVAWPHEAPAMELRTFMDFNGKIGPIEIYCRATDEDPLMNMFVAPTVRNCRCKLEDLPEALHAVWAERQDVIDQGRSRPNTSRFAGRWLWEAPEESLGGS